MQAITILLINGFFLSFLLFILLVIFASKSSRPKQKLRPSRGKIKDDIKKIKDQINGE